MSENSKNTSANLKALKLQVETSLDKLDNKITTITTLVDAITDNNKPFNTPPAFDNNKKINTSNA